MAYIRIIAFISLIFAPCLASAQVTTDVKDYQVAKIGLRIGAADTLNLRSIVRVITAAATHHQSPTAKAVYDYCNTLSTNLAFSGASSPVTLNSSTGTDVTFTAGTGISLSATSTNTTITNTAPDQTVSIVGATGTYPNFILPDQSATNEAQTLSVATNTATLSQISGVGGGSVTIAGAGINTVGTSGNTITVTGTEVDGSTTNEIQSLSLSGQTLGISGGGTGVTLPVVGVSAGAGISVNTVAGVTTVTNTGDTNSGDDITGSGIVNRIPYYSGTKTLTSNAGITTSNGTDVIAERFRTGSGANRRMSIVTGSTAFSDNAIRINTNIVWNTGTGSVGTYMVNCEYSHAQGGNITAVAGVIKIHIQTYSGTGAYFHVNVMGEWGRSTTATLYKNASDEFVVFIGEITDDSPYQVYLTDVYTNNAAAVGNIVTGISGAANTTGLTSVATCQNIVQTRVAPYRINLSGAANTVNHALQLGGSGEVDSEIGLMLNAYGTVNQTTAPSAVGFGIWNIAAKRRGSGAPDLFFRRNGVDVAAMTSESRLSVGVPPASAVARITARGEGATSGSMAFLAENSAGTDILWTLDNATVGIAGTGGTATSITGRDASNIVTNVTVGNGLSLTSGTLSATNNGTVTSVSVATSNGFAGSVSTASTTPAITLSTTVTGILKGNGTAISAAVAGTDYVTGNLYTTNGTLTGPRTVTMNANTITWNANAAPAPDVHIIQGGANTTRAFIFQNNLGNPKSHISYRDTMTTIGSYSGGNVEIRADQYALEVTRTGGIVIPDNVSPLASEKLGALTYNSNNNGLWVQAQTGAVGKERVATVQNDLTPNSTLAIAGNTTLSGKNWTARADANAGSFTITVGAQLTEGQDYIVACKRNSVNTITFTAAATYSLVHDLDTALTSGNLVSGGVSGTGFTAPGRTYIIRRSGSLIFIK